MKQTPANTVGAGYAVALCGAAAATLAVFYHGPEIPLLAAVQFLLVTSILPALIRAYDNGVRLPLTPVAASLTCFWLWLGISLAWSKVPVVSVVNFWWVGAFVVAFWAYTLAAPSDRVWFHLGRFALAGAAALCGYALLQVFHWHEPPRATFINIHSFGALMMLIALPLGGYFVIAWHDRAGTRKTVALGASLFVLFFTIATTEGRGTGLAIFLGMVAFAPFAARAVGRRPVAALLALLVAAYLAANLALHGGLGDRIATLADPEAAALPRWLIWRGSWRMLLAHPWWGVGLGTYYLAWPPYRDPADDSLGFFVHNDYLQIWIEAGLPALLLLLATYISVAIVLVRVLRSRASAALKVEALGLFAGLFAVAAHSFVDFDLYILSISITAGFVLARFHQRASDAVPACARVLQPARAMSGRAYTLIVLLIAAFPLSYFAALGISDFLYKRGFALAAEGKLQESDRSLTWAERLLPNDDKVLTMHADLYRHVLARLPRDAAERRTLYDAAGAMLGAAQSANPYRPLIHAVRGRLLQENPDLAGADWRQLAESAYADALTRDPRYFLTRTAYARLLLEAGSRAQALRILEDGMAYWYFPDPQVLGYYALTAQVARDLGDRERVAQIERRMEELRQAIPKLAPVRPIVPDLAPPTVASSLQ